MTDRGRIYGGSFLRALAKGLAGVVLGIYLARIGLSVVALGLVLSAGLAGRRSPPRRRSLRGLGVEELESYRATIFLFAALMAASLPFYLALSDRVEPGHGEKHVPLTPRGRSIPARICALFALHGVGGGFLGPALFS